MKKKRDRLWTDPKFKKMIKMEACRRGMTTVKYTEMLARSDEDIEEILYNEKKFTFRM